MTDMMWLVWFILGVGFALLELVLPGFIAIFFGIGCWVVALLLLLGVELGIAVQIGIFLVSTVTSLLLLRRWMMRVFRGVMADRPEQEFDDQPIGKIVSVTQSIQPPQTGRISYRGTEWDAMAEEAIETGAQVEITGRNARAPQQFIVRSINRNKEE